MTATDRMIEELRAKLSAAENLGHQAFKIGLDHQARAIALEAKIETLSAALDLDKAIKAAALTWCGEKDRETFLSDIEYFRENWEALPGLCAYVDRELGRAARAVSTPSAKGVET